jgi:hypothetical protein
MERADLSEDFIKGIYRNSFEAGKKQFNAGLKLKLIYILHSYHIRTSHPPENQSDLDLMPAGSVLGHLALRS